MSARIDRKLEAFSMTKAEAYRAYHAKCAQICHCLRVGAMDANAAEVATKEAFADYLKDSR